MVVKMAKRKKSKEASSKGMSVELTGLILAIIGIIGFGFGYVGALIKGLAYLCCLKEKCLNFSHLG